MFLIKKADQVLVESPGITWDNVPQEIDVMNMVSFRGELIEVPQSEQYFYSNEGTMQMSVSGDEGANFSLTASIGGGITGDTGILIKCYIDGRTIVKLISRKDLTFINSVYRSGVKKG